MEIYSWCIMPSHVHLVFRAKDANPGELLKSFKTYTPKTLQQRLKNYFRKAGESGFYG
ncbi:MAG TPA: transposase [Pedobacter sp.]